MIENNEKSNTLKNKYENIKNKLDLKTKNCGQNQSTYIDKLMKISDRLT